ncbi:hypothetical protein SDC9_154558 [bioreactor metagenome]|uniref:Uncharacterized protein n=1 Tax=bioreactor metagenome TaxID=1076179 RepID=A0A645F1A7_9ZZZZ
MAQRPGGGQDGAPGAARSGAGGDLRRGLAALHTGLDRGGSRICRGFTGGVGGGAAQLLRRLRRLLGALQIVVLAVAKLLLVFRHGNHLAFRELGRRCFIAEAPPPGQFFFLGALRSSLGR